MVAHSRAGVPSPAPADVHVGGQPGATGMAGRGRCSGQVMQCQVHGGALPGLS